jgi:hypothetical protein
MSRYRVRQEGARTEKVESPRIGAATEGAASPMQRSYWNLSWVGSRQAVMRSVSAVYGSQESLRFRMVPEGEEVEFAPDSPLEGDGFEPSVPRLW